jgi:hypothetical protein
MWILKLRIQRQPNTFQAVGKTTSTINKQTISPISYNTLIVFEAHDLLPHQFGQ